MQIREANISDLDQILEIYYENSKEMLHIDDITLMLDYDKENYGDNYKFLSLENLKSWLEKNSNKLIVAEANGRITGFIIYHYIEKRQIGYIEEIHVKKSQRNRGIGSILLHEAEKRLFNKGVRFIFLEAQKGSVPFFIKLGYIPLRKESSLYMNRLEYIDMIKLPNIGANSLVKSALEGFMHGEESFDLIKKVFEKLDENKLSSEYINVIYLVLFAEEEDNNTQSYIPLYRKIKKEAGRILEKGSVFRQLIDAIGYRILAYGLIDLGNYERASKLLERGLDKLKLVKKFMDEDVVWNTHPFVLLRDFTTCYILYIQSMKNFSDNYLEYFKTGKITKQNELNTNICKNFQSQSTEMTFFRESQDWILKFLKKSKLNTAPNATKLSGTIYFLNFFKIEDYEDKFIIKQDPEILKDLLKEIIGPQVIFSENRVISEDIIPELQKRNLSTHISFIINDPKLYVQISDQPFNKLVKSSAIDVVLFENGTGIIRFMVGFENLTPLELYHLSFITNSSILEFNIRLGDFFFDIKNVKTKELEDWNSLWLSIRFALVELSKRLGTGKVLMESEPISYVLVNISSSNVKNPADLKKFPEIYAIMDRVQTVMAGPSIYFRRYIARGDTFFDNLASYIGFEEGEIYASDTGMIIFGTTIPQWIIDEIIELTTLIVYQRFYLYVIRDKLDKFVTIEQKKASLKLSTGKVNELRTEILTKLWILSSPLPLRYSEYINFINALKSKIGIKHFEKMIKEQLSSLSTIIEIEQMSALHELQVKSEEERKVLDYIFTIVGVLGFGEILWRIINVMNPQVPQYILLVIYASLILISITILRFGKMKGKEEERLD